MSDNESAVTTGSEAGVTVMLSSPEIPEMAAPVREILREALDEAGPGKTARELAVAATRELLEEVFGPYPGSEDEFREAAGTLLDEELFSPEEVAALRDRAAASGLSLPNYCRLLGTHLRPGAIMAAGTPARKRTATGNAVTLARMLLTAEPVTIVETPDAERTAAETAASALGLAVKDVTTISVTGPCPVIPARLAGGRFGQEELNAVTRELDRLGIGDAAVLLLPDGRIVVSAL